MGSPVSARRKALTIAAVGTLVIWAYAILALVQILWLNPLAAVPGVSREQIWQDMSAAHESMSAPLVVGVMSVGPIIAVWVFVRRVMPAALAPKAVAIVYLTIVVLGPIAYFMASFGPGMALADTYAISGDDKSPWARPLHAVSGVALLTLIGVAAGSRVHRTHQPALM